MSNSETAVSSITNGVDHKSLSHANLRKTERFAWVDLVRVSSAFLIVVNHVNPFSPYFDHDPESAHVSLWLAGDFAALVSRCAVPMFLMISGYLLLTKKSLKHGYFNRLLKVGIPLVAWFTIYLGVYRAIGHTDFMGNPVTFYNGIRCFITGKAQHLWFLFAILALYIAAPILHSYLKSASRENKTYFLVVCAFACFAYPLLCAVLQKQFDVDEIGFKFHIMNTSIGYFVAGYFLGRLTISKQTFFWCLISFVIIVSSVTTITCTSFTSSLGEIFSQMETPLRQTLIYNPSLHIPLALLLFVILKYIGESQFYRQSKFSVGISRLAVFTFGVFLVHILVRQALGTGGLKILNNADYPWFSLLADPFIVFFLSVAMVWCLRKIPLSRWILP